MGLGVLKVGMGVVGWMMGAKGLGILKVDMGVVS